MATRGPRPTVGVAPRASAQAGRARVLASCRTAELRANINSLSAEQSSECAYFTSAFSTQMFPHAAQGVQSDSVFAVCLDLWISGTDRAPIGHMMMVISANDLYFETSPPGYLRWTLLRTPEQHREVVGVWVKRSSCKVGAGARMCYKLYG